PPPRRPPADLVEERPRRWPGRSRSTSPRRDLVAAPELSRVDLESATDLADQVLDLAVHPRPELQGPGEALLGRSEAGDGLVIKVLGRGHITEPHLGSRLLDLDVLPPFCPEVRPEPADFRQVCKGRLEEATPCREGVRRLRPGERMAPLVRDLGPIQEDLCL